MSGGSIIIRVMRAGKLQKAKIRILRRLAIQNRVARNCRHRLSPTRLAEIAPPAEVQPAIEGLPRGP
jgi:hypothetical protein